MNSHQAISFLALTLLASCASPVFAEPSVEDSGWTAVPPQPEEAAATPMVAQPVAAPANAAPVRTQQDPVSSIWRDPGFRRRVQQSLVLKSEVEPGMTEQESKILNEVVEKISTEQFTTALQQLKANSTATSTAQFDFMRGYVLYFEEDLVGAAQAFQVAVEKFPNFLRAWQLYGQVLLEQEDLPAAQMALSQALQIGGANSDLYGTLGYTYSLLGDDMSAESCYRMATVLDPGTQQWKEGLAISFFQQGKFAELVAYTGTLLVDQPDSRRLWDLQAKAYIRLGQPLRAAENYELIEMLGEADFGSLATLADIYVNEQLWDLAVGAYQRAVSLEDQAAAPDRPLAAAKVMIANSAYGDAMQMVDLVELHFGDQLDEEQSKDLWRLRELTAALTDEPERQIEALKQVLALDPLDGQALLKLGRLYLAAEDYPRAIIQFERAAGLEKFEARAKLGQAQALVGQDKYAEAVPLLRASLALDDREPVRRYLEQIESLAAGR